MGGLSKSYMCVKCGKENYIEGDAEGKKCVLPADEKWDISNPNCKGALKEASVYECEACHYVEVADTYPRCKFCKESMRKK